MSVFMMLIHKKVVSLRTHYSITVLIYAQIPRRHPELRVASHSIIDWEAMSDSNHS